MSVFIPSLQYQLSISGKLQGQQQSGSIWNNKVQESRRSWPLECTKVYKFNSSCWHGLHSLPHVLFHRSINVTRLINGLSHMQICPLHQLGNKKRPLVQYGEDGRSCHRDEASECSHDWMLRNHHDGEAAIACPHDREQYFQRINW